MEDLKNKRILVGIPSASGMISAYVFNSYMQLDRPCPIAPLIIERQSVDEARNYIMEIAIRMQVDYIFFGDDDGVLPTDTLTKLIEDDKDIVGAPMMTRNPRERGEHALCVFEKYDFYIGDGKNVSKYRSMKELRDPNDPKKYLFSVDATGGACLLIKREAFEALFLKHNGRPFEFIHETHITKEHGVTLRNISEDMCFSERAKESGFEIWIDTRIRPVHLGKPKFTRFEMEGEDLPLIKEPLRGVANLSESLKIDNIDSNGKQI